MDPIDPSVDQHADAPSALEELVADAVAGRGVVVESVRVAGAADAPTVEVLLDRASGTEGLSLDEAAELSGAVSEALDAAGDDVPGVGAGEYVLEVGSVGVDRPLTLPRHWARNVGRLVEASVDGAAPVTGRVLGVDGDGVELEVVRPGAKKGMPAKVLPAEHIRFDRLGPGLVQVEWSTAAEPAGHGTEHTAEQTEA